MIHTFTCMGVELALDVHSGAVYQVDPLARAVMERYESHTPEAIHGELSQTFAPADVAETLAEVQELKDSGALFAPDVYTEALAVQHEPVVKAMCLHAAHDCDLRCRYCFAGGGDYAGPRGLLPEATGRAALDFLLAHSANRPTLEVDFFGGEPLLNLEVVKGLVAYGRSLEGPKRFKFTMTTNGIGLTSDACAFINGEMDNVVISIDGREQVHDRMRPTPNGKGSHAIAVRNAKALLTQRNRGSHYIRGTFTRHNLDFMQDVKALHEAGFHQLSLEPVVADTSCEYALQEQDLPDILAEYERLAAYVWEQERNGRGFTFFHYMLDLSQGPCVQKRLTGCGAGAEYVAVTPEGDIYPCHQFVGAGYRMGNVNDGTFDAGIQQAFQHNHVLNKPDCQDCWAKFYCSGGCAANGYRFGGDIRAQYRLGCEMERKRLECALALHVLRNNE